MSGISPGDEAVPVVGDGHQCRLNLQGRKQLDYCCERESWSADIVSIALIHLNQ